jgi:hypothetical protein
MIRMVSLDSKLKKGFIENLKTKFLVVTTLGICVRMVYNVLSA